MITTGLDAHRTAPVVISRMTVIQRFVTRLQPDLVTLGILRRWHLQLGQRRDMIFRQIPNLAAVEVGLGAEITIETAMRRNGRIDQQGLEAVSFGEMRCIVSAEGAADQQRPGRGNVCTPVTRPDLVCRLLLETSNRS